MRHLFRQAAYLSLLLVALLLLATPAQLVREYSIDTASAGLQAKPKNSQLSRLNRAMYRKHGGARSSSSPDLNAQMDSVFMPVNAHSSVNNAMMRAQGIDGVTRGIDTVVPAEFNGDVRNLPQVAVTEGERPEFRGPRPVKKGTAQEGGVTQDAPSTVTIAAPMPTPSVNFAGVSRTDTCTGGPCGDGTPPDINGDVGLNNYIMAVNSSYAIYSKTGTLQASFTENSLFSAGPTGTLCDTDSFGDPVVVYEQFADRWFLTNFAFVLNGTTGNQDPPTYQCFAVSKTSDPVSGGWWLYAVQIDTNGVGQPPTGTLADYPKFGNWNDGCLYMAGNGFDVAGSYVGVVYGSFKKSAMESGAALTASNSSLGFLLADPTSGDPFTIVPSNISGAKGAANVPPAGTPNYFVSESQTAFAWEVRKFTPGANCGSGGTLGAATNVSQTGYNPPYNATTTAIVPQPNTTNTLDTVDDRVMQKVQYRRIGAAESLWVVHNVCRTGTTFAACTANTGMQWAQINVTGTTVSTTPVQQQKYAPDTTIYRWMGSLAVDHVGNMALGYSTSNGTSPNFPSIAYAGRLVTDATGTLPQTEVQMQAGGGSQTHNCGGSPCNRWGDYTAMSVDPADDCTFWYTNEYYDTQANGTTGNWHTRVGSFKFPTCTNAPTSATTGIQGRITNTDGQGVGGVTVELSGARAMTAITDALGNYHFDDLEAGGFYNVNPSLANYSFSPASRAFSLVGNSADASFTASFTSDSANPLDANAYFVRQQYLDFLGREPDSGGLQYWTSRFNECGGDAACITRRRIDVSAAFFMSDEFQQTGSFVYRLYKAGLGRDLSYPEFSADRSQVLAGDDLNARRSAFATAFVSRPEFAERYGSALTADSFVNALIQTVKQSSGVDLSAQRDALMAKYDAGASMNEGRALALSEAAEMGEFKQSEYNPSFVLIEYFGYLKRDADHGGYDFWLDVLNNRVPGNYRSMVCAFITSSEYQRRFSPVITRSNSECGQ